MFIRSFQYAIKNLARDKAYVFWSLLFPIVLATLFSMAFSGLSSEEMFHAIPVAVVMDSADAGKTDASSQEAFKQIIDSLSKDSDEPFLDVVFVSEDEALELLKNKEIAGIIYGESPVSLAVSAEMTTVKLEQSILSSFVEQYNMNASAITSIATTHPKQLGDVMELLSSATEYNKEVQVAASGTMDQKLVYFFNLIAMTCLFACLGGLSIATNNQANLSSLGARKCISPVHKNISLLGELCACFTLQFLCVLVSLLYMLFILNISFGTEFGYVALAALMGCIAGVSLGFFVGSFGRMSENIKVGILMATTMICCFLSGLMVGSMRVLVAQVCPWFNHINPAALISDSFYSLTVYQSHSRYFQNLGILLLLSTIFCIAGFLMVRRKKYETL